MTKRRSLRNVSLFLVGLSLLQYVSQGEVSWPLDAWQGVTKSIGEYTGRPDAGWRKAADAIEDLGAAKDGNPVPGFDLKGRVVRVADGDTLSILTTSNQQYKIRLHGIDSPERDQPYGTAAGAVLSRLVAGKSVGVAVIEKDQFGRFVGTVYLDGGNVNLAMIKGGHAWWYQRHAQYNRPYGAAQKEAKNQNLGLWAQSNPVAPWDWRRQARYTDKSRH
ncbi:MAG: thermonuclease family protein [Halioglobus sp.]